MVSRRDFSEVEALYEPAKERIQEQNYSLELELRRMIRILPKR